MKKPKSLKECRSADEVQAYIIANDGLSDEDVEGFEFVEVGPDDDPANIVPVLFDPPTLARLRKIAKKKNKPLSSLIRDWAAERSKRESAQDKPSPVRQEKKRARG